MATSVFGNSGFSTVEDTTLSLSKLLAPVESLVESLADAPFQVGTLVYSSTLTSQQLTQATTYPGLNVNMTELFPGTSLASALVLNTADTAAEALRIATACGLTGQGDSKLIHFYTSGLVTAVATLGTFGNTVVNVILQANGAAPASPLPISAVTAGAGINSFASAIVTFTTALSGSEQVTINILSNATPV